jgi:hypothetical protein
MGERCPQTLPSYDQQRIDRPDEPVDPGSRISRSGRSWGRRLDKLGERARYAGGIKSPDVNRGEERF